MSLLERERRMQYGQFCPIAKATEILGEKWTILIIRELIMGGRRFNELQRGLGDISPALLTSRLKSLEEQGMVAKRKVSGQKSYEYFPTPACLALKPVLVSLGEWGILYAQHTTLDDYIDAEFLMLYLERSIDPDHLVGDESVIQFRFTDLKEQQTFWLLVQGSSVDMCLKDPGKDVSVYFTSTLKTMSDVWMGEMTYTDALRSGDLIMQGEPALTRNVRSWLRPSIFEQSPRTPLRAVG